jgi:hypothetical protein
MTPILTAHLSEARRADLAPAIGILAEWSNKRGKKARQRLPEAWAFFERPNSSGHNDRPAGRHQVVDDLGITGGEWHTVCLHSTGGEVYPHQNVAAILLLRPTNVTASIRRLNYVMPMQITAHGWSRGPSPGMEDRSYACVGLATLNGFEFLPG